MFPAHWSAAHDNAMEEFAAQLRISKRSPSTIEAYGRNVRGFLWTTVKPVKAIVAPDAFDYLVFLNDKKKLGARTIDQNRSTLKLFYSDILEIPLPKKLLKYSKQPSRIPETLTLKEAAALFEAESDPQLRTMFMTMYASGLRLAETTHLRLKDIDSDRMVIHVRLGKGAKDRDVMLSQRLLVDLRTYWRRYRPTEWLFPGRHDGPISHKKVQQACRKTAARAGISKRVTPHTLRHSFAAQLLRNGVSLRYIQELLGHADIKTTMIYLRVVPESLDVTSPLDMLDF